MKKGNGLMALLIRGTAEASIRTAGIMIVKTAVIIIIVKSVSSKALAALRPGLFAMKRA